MTTTMEFKDCPECRECPSAATAGPLTTEQIEAGLKNTRDALDALARAASSVAKEPGKTAAEPWRPSVDEWDLLPDADPRRR